MPMSTKCQKILLINVIQHNDFYDHFTMEHFTLRQSMILTTSFFLLVTVCTTVKIKVDLRSLTKM
jgi:hypothetical protein